MFEQFAEFQLDKMIELKEHFYNFIEEQDDEWIEENREDLHHYAFNEVPYIIGTYKAEQWLGDYSLIIADIVRRYEQDNFGETYTDLSKPEKVVNMYAYIKGEHIVANWLEGALV